MLTLFVGLSAVFSFWDFDSFVTDASYMCTIEDQHKQPAVLSKKIYFDKQKRIVRMKSYADSGELSAIHNYSWASKDEMKREIETPRGWLGTMNTAFTSTTTYSSEGRPLETTGEGDGWFFFIWEWSRSYGVEGLRTTVEVRDGIDKTITVESKTSDGTLAISTSSYSPNSQKRFRRVRLLKGKATTLERGEISGFDDDKKFIIREAHDFFYDKKGNWIGTQWTLRNQVMSKTSVSEKCPLKMPLMLYLDEIM